MGLGPWIMVQAQCSGSRALDHGTGIVSGMYVIDIA